MHNSIAFLPVVCLVVAVVALGFLATNNALKNMIRLTTDSRARRQLAIVGFLRGMLYFGSLLLLGGAAFGWWTQRREAQRAYAEWKERLLQSYDPNHVWQAPDWKAVGQAPQAELILYGRDLIAHTTDYFGGQGLVRPGSINELNCQNCHLGAGAKPFGNNYAAVASTYPKFRARSGAQETIAYRVNDCFQRSLNGMPLDTNSREMRAIIAYIRWLGLNVPAKEIPKGAGLKEVPFLPRPAEPAQGEAVFAAKCASCHGADGQGLPMPDSPRRYPPLWGDKSYAASAGLFRLSRLAAYLKANMPFGASWESPQLSDAEAWDVAAYINTQPRPAHRFLQEDWPDISKKPYDHPFGPYADSFPEQQHKYGPFQPIVDFYKKPAAK